MYAHVVPGPENAGLDRGARDVEVSQALHDGLIEWRLVPGVRFADEDQPQLHRFSHASNVRPGQASQ